jgi:D-cysteine desulfhydrase
MTGLPPRISLAQLPTPFERLDRLSAAWGGPPIWVKRDDLTGFGVSGNKVRKLEFHFAGARHAGTDTLVTCGAAQSNHCRATALAAARTGFDVVLALRTPDGRPPNDLAGNLLLDRLAGAEVRFITPDEYERRDAVMAEIADELAAAGRRPWVIPEGASDALGMWGFVVAMQELDQQVDRLPGGVAAVWHAASSGGTTAGLGWATDRMGLDIPIVGSSVGDTVPDLRRRIDAIWAEAVAAHGGRYPTPHLELVDEYVGLGYGRATEEELQVQAEATSLTGLVLDPTYTGKALYGLWREIKDGRFSRDDHVVFWHTGGGFAVFSHDFAGALG